MRTALSFSPARRHVAVVSIALTVIVAIAVVAVPAASFAAKPAKAKKRIGGQYKRIHQRALKGSLTGGAEKAIAALNAYLDKYPDDAESQYMLANIQLRQGEKNLAIASMQRALELGLPAGRFVSGANSPFRALAGREDYDKILDQHAHVPVHGPMLGCLTDQSVSVWVRTAQPAEVKVELATADDFKEIAATGQAMAAAETDMTAVVELDGLKPHTVYFYRVVINGQAGTQARPLAFRTFGPSGKPTQFRVAFGGGAGFVPPHEYVWNTILAEKPDAMFLLGDNIYSDDPTTPEIQDYSYFRRQSRAEYRRLVAVAPVYAIWDDHDFGTNDCHGGPEIDVPAWKRPVWKRFRNNWVNPAYGGGDQNPGVWYDFRIGDVQFFMIDGRYYRDPKPTDGQPPTMLGPVQKAWLFERLAASAATFKVICSPVPFDFAAKPGSKDPWNGYREERAELFGFLTKNNIQGVVLMSADRHRSDLWRLTREGDYPLYDLNSSRLTNQHVHGKMPESVFSYNEKQSFGTVDFNTTLDDPTVTYRIVNIDGEEVYKFTIRRSQLQ